MYYVARHFSLRAPATCPTMLQRLQPNETENVDCLQSNTFHVDKLDSSNTTCAIFRNRAALFTNALSYIKATREKYSKFVLFFYFLSSTLLRNVLVMHSSRSHIAEQAFVLLNFSTANFYIHRRKFQTFDAMNDRIT